MTPKTAGFYWGKWRIKAEGTVDEDESPGDEWEVMHVVTNCIDEDDPEHLMVMVPGVAKWQALDGFVWGPRVSPPTPAASHGGKEGFVQVPRKLPDGDLIITGPAAEVRINQWVWSIILDQVLRGVGSGLTSPSPLHCGEKELAGLMGWQPIETAPKDGTVIDVWVVTKYVRRNDLNTAERVANAYWGSPWWSGCKTAEIEDTWVKPAESCTVEAIEREITGGSRLITHWMPLPLPPEGGE